MIIQHVARAVLFAITAAWLVAPTTARAQRAADCQCGESTLDKITKRGVLKAGVRFSQPPFGYLDRDGKNVGFTADMARAFAEKLKVKVEFVQTTNQTREPLLLNGSIDLEFGPTTVTKKREEVVDFSIVYLWDGGGIVVRKGESKSPKDYGIPSKTVAATQGSSIAADFVKRFPGAKMLYFQEYTDCITALLNRKVDAVVASNSAGVLAAKKFDKIEAGETFYRDPTAIMVRQNDSKWRNWVNWTLQELWAEGRYQKMYEAHYGTPPNFHLWSETMLQPGIGKP